MGSIAYEIKREKFRALLAANPSLTIAHAIYINALKAANDKTKVADQVHDADLNVLCSNYRKGLAFLDEFRGLSYAEFLREREDASNNWQIALTDAGIYGDE